MTNLIGTKKENDPAKDFSSTAKVGRMRNLASRPFPLMKSGLILTAPERPSRTGIIVSQKSLGLNPRAEGRA